MVRRWLLAACLGGGIGAVAVAEPPQRVLSMNLCTDQLAMMLAGPGQLVSVSHLALDPRASAMTREAAGYEVNHGLAEEVFVMQPDLVLAGRYTSQTAVDLLRRLGVRVEEFDIVNDLDGLRDGIRRMGQVLGREAEAQRIIADFDADLARLGDAPGPDPSAALYSANGYSSGDSSLAGQILLTAGFRNIAADAGIPFGGFLPLELLVLADPDLVVLDSRNQGASRAEEIYDHPALRHVMAQSPVETVSDRDWICGTPHVLRAIQTLAGARAALVAGP